MLFEFLSLGALVRVCWTDVRTMTLDDTWAVVGLFGLCAGRQPLFESVLSAVFLTGLLGGVGWILRTKRGRPMLGGGDLRLMIASGPWVPFEAFPFFMLFTSGVGLLWAWCWTRAVPSPVPMRFRKVPFAPAWSIALASFILYKA